MGRVVSRTDPNGNTERRVYDSLGRPIRIDEPDSNVRRIAYDGEGNVVRVTDAHNDVAFTYQGMGRLASRTQAGTTVRFQYDSEEQLIGIVNEHGHVYRFELDPRGDVRIEHGFDGVRRGYERDRAGRVTKLVRASGITSAYHYDPVGRVRAVDHSDGAREEFRYRADGLLVEAANDATRIKFERDSLGRVVREMSDLGWIASEYDPRGQRIRMHSSLGADQRVDRNPMGDVIGLHHSAKDTPKPFDVRFDRDMLGLELERNLPGGVRARWRRDKLGRPIEHEITVAGHTLQARAYRWLEDDRLKAIIDSQTGPVEYAHDALGNLAWVEHADGSRELRMPDAVGNLFRTEDRKDRKYGPSGHLLESTDNHGRITTYAYDTEGNLIEKCRSDGSRWRYRWAADGMLRQVERPDGATVTFAYDPLGRRVRKSFGRKITRWVWDGNVPLHEWVETDAPAPLEVATGDYAEVEASAKLREALRGDFAPRGPPDHGTTANPITWLFEPESFSPLAKLVGGRRYSIISDHLGTPTSMLDERGSVVWSAEVDTWGQLRRLEGDRAACPFRWPGQYEDAETGLYYNRFRYYDTDAGQYVSQDPTGLAGGLRLSSYVRDTTTSIDPLGLAASCKLGHVESQHDAMNPGSLSDDLAATFAGGRYAEVILDRDTILYRAGTSKTPLGQFFSSSPPTSVIQTRIDKAVLPRWPGGGTSPIDSSFAVRVPKGSRVYVGEVGSQGGHFIGGTEQIVVPKPWTISGVDVVSATPLK